MSFGGAIFRRKRRKNRNRGEEKSVLCKTSKSHLYFVFCAIHEVEATKKSPLRSRG